MHSLFGQMWKLIHQTLVKTWKGLQVNHSLIHSMCESKRTIQHNKKTKWTKQGNWQRSTTAQRSRQAVVEVVRQHINIFSDDCVCICWRPCISTFGPGQLTSQVFFKVKGGTLGTWFLLLCHFDKKTFQRKNIDQNNIWNSVRQEYSLLLLMLQDTLSQYKWQVQCKVMSINQWIKKNVYVDLNAKELSVPLTWPGLK